MREDGWARQSRCSAKPWAPGAPPWAPATLQERGKLGEALPLTRETVAASRATLGANSPVTLTSMGILVTLLGRMGGLGEAVQLERQALGGLRASLGHLHERTLASMGCCSRRGALGARARPRRCCARRWQGLGVCWGAGTPTRAPSCNS